MVRALLAGRKTMTRRLAWRDAGFGLQDYASEQLEDMELRGWDVVGEGDAGLFRVWKPTPWQKVKPGDRLWVREGWKPHSIYGQMKPSEMPRAKVFYLADDGYEPSNTAGRPSIHMPRWASRLTLVVTATKIEPLLDISESDALAEGLQAGPLNDGFGQRDAGGGWTVSSPGGFASAAGMFQILWTKLHPEWDGFSSPTVMAITFAVVRANIDGPEVSALADLLGGRNCGDRAAQQETVA